MEPIYSQNFEVTDIAVDCYGRMKASMILFIAQEVAGMHCKELSLDSDALAQRHLIWAITRHKVQITRLPMLGQTIRLETWPMPTTRVAYPRSMVAYDSEGNELFRSISIWVLMDLEKRTMVLPGKSGIDLEGTLRGNELAAPGGLVAKSLSNSRERTVCFTDLDRNLHEQYPLLRLDHRSAAGLLPPGTYPPGNDGLLPLRSQRRPYPAADLGFFPGRHPAGRCLPENRWEGRADLRGEAAVRLIMLSKKFHSFVYSCGIFCCISKNS